ncbi:MAG TPA: cyclase family protein [Thermoanaerobaculia bacterium]|nr:cyclase family protein [Thermoanaerobaculia bacterium]
MSERPGNWGKWGDDDERGTLNYITPEVTAAAARLARTGKVYPLSIPLRAEAPIWPGRHKNWHVATHRNVSGPGPGGAEDILMIHTHGTTHMDALCHVFRDGRLYNGWPAAEHVTSRGATRNAIHNVGAIVTRGVLLDVAGHRGVEHLPAGEVITPDELEAVAAAQRVEIRSGDALLLRTGWLSTWERDADAFNRSQPGPSLEAARWAGCREITVLAADNSAVEAFPVPEGLPVHQEFLRDQGGYLMELLDLDALARDRVWEFLFVVAPLRLWNGLGSPITPLAIC